MDVEDVGKRGGGGVGSGLLLLGLGVVFLLVQFDLLRDLGLRNAWPLAPLGLGLWTTLHWKDAQELGFGVTLSLIGVWLLVSDNGWWGLGWSDAWPLALVAVGAGMVVRSMVPERSREARHV